MYDRCALVFGFLSRVMFHDPDGDHCGFHLCTSIHELYYCAIVLRDLPARLMVYGGEELERIKEAAMETYASAVDRLNAFAAEKARKFPNCMLCAPCWQLAWPTFHPMYRDLPRGQAGFDIDWRGGPDMRCLFYELSEEDATAYAMTEFANLSADFRRQMLRG